MTTKDRTIVEFGGVKFYMEERSTLFPLHTWTVLIPCDDPDWMLRHCEKVAPRDGPEGGFATWTENGPEGGKSSL